MTQKEVIEAINQNKVIRYGNGDYLVCGLQIFKTDRGEILKSVALKDMGNFKKTVIWADIGKVEVV